MSDTKSPSPSESRLKPWTIVDSKYVHQDPWLSLRVDRCKTSSGHIVESYDVLEVRDWINVVALTEDLKMILVREYRHGTRKIYWGLPSGYLDSTDANPEAGCRRELLEETGYKGGEFISLGSYPSNPASYTNTCHAFLALGVQASGTHKWDASEEIEIGLWDLADLFKQIRSQKMEFQAIHMASLFLMEGYLSQTKDPKLRPIQEKLRTN